MDIIRLNNVTNQMRMDSGEIINDIKSKMWIERYREAGEFTIVAPVNSDVRKKLPIGCFISHTNTPEIMIVENHEIKDSRSSESDVVITGRSFETLLENRVVGSNVASPHSGTLVDIPLAANYTWNQVVSLIHGHMETGLLNSANVIPYVITASLVPGTATGVSIARAIKRGSLYSAVMDLLVIDNLGIKSVRPVIGVTPNSYIYIHKGVDKSATLMISHDSGEIESADYLWSNKKFKNAVLVTGKWVEVLVYYPTTATGFNRRMMFVSASDIDQDFTVAPTGTDYTNVVNALNQRGMEALASQKNIAITNADVSRDARRHFYRSDYDLGDLVTVQGDYNEKTIMRITEYVESEDETGASGYPTLSIDE